MIGLIGLCLMTGNAQGQSRGDAIRGAALADSWCKSCHIVDKKGNGTAIDPAPPFPQIAKDPKKTTAYLKNWLGTSHPQMPNFNLGRREVEDLIAHIRSQAPVN